MKRKEKNMKNWDFAIATTSKQNQPRSFFKGNKRSTNSDIINEF